MNPQPQRQPPVIPERGGHQPSVPSHSVNLGGGHAAAAGINNKVAPHGSQQRSLRDGSAIQRRPDGRISDVRDARRGVDIHNGLNGRRSVSVERPDHSRIFAERGRPGYIRREYSFRGHDFARRAYYFHGRAYNRFYRPYGYRGVLVDVYAPGLYYGPGFYGWVYNPWYAPVAYTWGWGGAAWVGYYGFYFAPAPVYPSAAFWLTDYMISQDLAANYQAQQEAQGAAAQSSDGAAQLTPEVKQQIAGEVKYQIALENQEAQQSPQNQDSDPGMSGIGRLLSDGNTHTFVAGADLDLVDTAGNECALSGGDVLALNTPPAPDAQAAELVVVASKGGNECRKADTVTVAFTDLQEMQNHMRETIDQGLQELQSKQGSGGLPAAPASARTAPVESAFAQAAPPPEPDGAQEVSQQLQQADAAEQEVTAQAQQESPAAGSPNAGPVTISLGQSMAQVTEALGQPVTMIDLGAKKIYQYRDMKVVFVDGKVSDVQ